jgi:hypothetical protein
MCYKGVFYKKKKKRLCVIKAYIKKGKYIYEKGQAGLVFVIGKEVIKISRFKFRR